MFGTNKVMIRILLFDDFVIQIFQNEDDTIHVIN